jgi:CRP-like cAMP-binding protein
VTGRQTSIGNRLLEALPPADFQLLSPHLQNAAFELDTVMIRSGDQFDQVFFPKSCVVAFMVEMPDGQTVATTLMGREGAVGSLSVLRGSLLCPVNVTVRVAGTAGQISAQKLQVAYARSAAIRHVMHMHFRAQFLQLQQAVACNALHPVERRAARWLLELHDRVGDEMLPVTQEVLAQLLGVRRTTVTQTMSRLRAAGAIKSDRRGWVEIDRARLESAACNCYRVTRRIVDHTYDRELSRPPGTVAPLQENSMVAEIEGGSVKKQ